MKDKEFIDTNVLVYAKLEDKHHKQKRNIAITTIRGIQDLPVISVQVLNEFAIPQPATMTKKKSFQRGETWKEL